MDSLRRKFPSSGSLFLFEAAARHENFTRAAEELNVTQPAVSRALAALEDHLGTKLFQRGKLGAHLTEDGLVLKEAVSGAFKRIDQGLLEIEARRSGKAQVTLSVSTAFTTHWLMPRITRCQKAFPNLDLRFQLIAGPVGGPLGNVDLAMRYAVPSEVTGRFIMHEAYAPVCAPGYLEELGPRTKSAFIELQGDRPARFSGVEGWTGQPGEAQLTFSDYSVVVQAALLGQGVAAGWLNVVAHWLREARLSPASEQLSLPGRVCQLVTRPDGRGPAVVDEFSDWLVAELHDDLKTVDADHPGLGINRLLQSEIPDI